MKHIEYNKLRNTIIENSEVIKEEVMRLEFWCRVKDTDWDTWMWTIAWTHWHRNLLIHRDNEKTKFYIERKQDVEDWDILWKDIEQKDLLAFCWEKKIYLAIDCYWDVSSWTNEIATINHSLPLKDQDPNQLGAITNFLIDNIE